MDNEKIDNERSKPVFLVLSIAASFMVFVTYIAHSSMLHFS